MLSLVLTMLGAAAAQAASIDVKAREFPAPGAALPQYTYIVNVDNVKDPKNPDPLQHPGLGGTESNSPVVATGNQATGSFSLPDGKYLISVQAPDHKLWGKHIVLPRDAGTQTINLRRYPLPFGKAKVFVYHDDAFTNSQPDDAEEGLAGFHITLMDQMGLQVSVGGDGEPLCGGTCVTNSDGYVEIPNLSPGTYFANATPPKASTGWVQTSTFLGAFPVQVGVEEGAEGTGFGSELLWQPPGIRSMWNFGFVKRQAWPVRGPQSSGTGSISGTARNWISWPPAEQLTIGEAVPKPYVALTDRATNTEVFMKRGNADGTFTIPHIPAGSYMLSIWDEQLNYIIRFINVEVAAGEQVDLNAIDGDGDGTADGAVGVPRWFGWLDGTVYQDYNGDGVRQPNEPPIPNTDVDERWRDGSIKAATFTDAFGHYSYPQAEGGANGKWFIGEVGFGRYATTGPSLHSEYDSGDVTALPTDQGGGLLSNQIISEGHHSTVDWGKQTYAEGQTGQIVGIVYHASTRNERNAYQAAHEDYEPGIPGVQVRLMGLGADGQPNTADDPTLNEYTTDHWQQPTDCTIKDFAGIEVTDPTLINPLLGPRCVESPNLGAQTKDGAFDGGYAFADQCAPVTPTPDNPTGSTFPCAGGDLAPLTPGKYITQVLMPGDGAGHDLYQINKEEDVNVDIGATYEPALPPYQCTGNDHVVASNDFTTGRGKTAGLHRKLCDKRLVDLKAKQNANADFYLFTKTDVEIPGRVIGLVSNDAYIDSDPQSVWYKSPRPEPDVPVGIYDREPTRGGRLITTVSTDENGEFEALLPSTDTKNCPTPQGMCPGMYWFQVNDPGTRANPNSNFKQDLLTSGGSYDVWPGQLDQLDVPVTPTSGGGCALPANTPELLQVSKPVVSSTDSSAASRRITIDGSFFGTSPGSISLSDPRNGQSRTLTGLNANPSVNAGGIVSWSETQIVVQIPAIANSTTNGFAAGPKQLLIRTAATPALTTPTGITIHVRGGSGGSAYNPPIVNVGAPTVGTPHALQNAIDGASAGDLLVLKPGTYDENVIMNKAVILQGLGTGGFSRGAADPTAEPAPLIAGTSISGRFFSSSAGTWRAKLNQMKPFSGNQTVPEGAAITVIAKSTGTNSAANLRTSSFGTGTNGLVPARIDGVYIKTSQGSGAGGIQVNAYGRNLQITNNRVEGNGGIVTGGIGLGVPFVGDNQNDDVTIRYDRIEGNGSKFSGGIGIFNGSERYQVRNSRICSNYSFNYGAGIAHYGLSSGGAIADNQIFYNDSFDSGAGLMISGELPPTTQQNPVQQLGQGAGMVDVDRNLIEGNFSGDDGGAMFIQNALTQRVNVRSNMMVDNGAAHMGGAMMLKHSSNVAIVNNTLAENSVTDTSEGRDGRSHGAAITSERHDPLFQNVVGNGNNVPRFSQPVALYNNIFNENHAFRLNMTTSPFSLDDLGLRDFEVDGVSGALLNVRRSIISIAYGNNNALPFAQRNLVGADPLFAAPFANEFLVTGSRIDPQLVSVTINRPNPPEGLAGDYHINAGSPAQNAGLTTLNNILAPTFDFEGNTRTQPFDLGADER